jgi:hypothetical protein
VLRKILRLKRDETVGVHGAEGECTEYFGEKTRNI